ncbi:MAG: DUF305 domain-containing protein, partial [Actinomycetia bacterium]|nr:DUF305 domain-containing protein [Actinomycetes bacterium]
MPSPASRSAAARAAAAVGFALAVSGCGIFDEPPEPIRLTAPPPSAATATTSAPATSNDADVEFVQAMILHRTELLALAELGEQQSTNPEVRLVAGETLAAASADLEQLQGWLAEFTDERGTPQPQPQISEDERSELREAEGAEFDRLLLGDLIAGHEAALEQVEELGERGIHEPTRALAEELGREDRVRLARLQAMFGEADEGDS